MVGILVTFSEVSEGSFLLLKTIIHGKPEPVAHEAV